MVQKKLYCKPTGIIISVLLNEEEGEKKKKAKGIIFNIREIHFIQSNFVGELFVFVWFGVFFDTNKSVAYLQSQEC